MAVPQKLCGIPTFAHPQLSNIILDFSHTEANELSAWDDRLRAHQLISTNCNRSGTMAVPLTGTASPTLPTKSQPTAWNNLLTTIIWWRGG